MKNLYFLFVSLILIPCIATSQNSNAHPGIEIDAKGTGRTTGHVITLNIRNTTPEPYIFNMGGYYFPSDGKHQGYIIPPIPDSTIVVEPEGETSIPLSGYCTEIDKPPVGSENPIDFDEGFAFGNERPPSPGHVNETVFRPIDSIGIVTIPEYDPLDTTTIRFNPLITTYPGTDVIFPYTIDITEHPEEAAPILFEVIDLITETYDSLRENDLIVTPFSFDKEKERKSVIQQTFWIYTSILGDEDPYDITDFESKMEEQLESNTGQDIDEMDEQVREQLTTGVNQFWNAFTLVGTEAKVISSEPSPPPPPVLEVEEDKKICEYVFDASQGFSFKMVIDDAWKNKKERDKIIKEAKEDLKSEGNWTPDSSYYSKDGGLQHHPTSASAFFKNNVIGGFCSGYAKTYFYTPGEGSRYVSSTDPINLHIENTSATVSLEVIPPTGWTSFVVGSSFTKLRASSSSFDAVAGNSEFGLDFLKVTRFAAKISIKFLIDLSTGQTAKSFFDYAKDAIGDELKSLTEEAAKEKLTEFINKNFKDLLGNKDISLNDIKDFAQGNSQEIAKRKLKEYLEGRLGIEIKSFDKLIDDGLDAFLNMFFVSNTYAAANGGLVVKIGSQVEDAKVNSKALYLRQELEDSSEAVTGTGEKVDSFYVSDVKAKKISIETIGNVLMMTRAKGNGCADAYIESIQLQVLLGVCKEPRAPMYYYTTQFYIGASFNDQENAPSMDQDFIDQLSKELDAKIIKDKLNYFSSMEEWKNTVDEFIREKSLSYPFNK
jgi:hypothetical protein